MPNENETLSKQQKAIKKKTYARPEIREVWSENIGLAGAYLLEM
jgi:hypothetical protein